MGCSSRGGSSMSICYKAAGTRAGTEFPCAAHQGALPPGRDTERSRAAAAEQLHRLQPQEQRHTGQHRGPCAAAAGAQQPGLQRSTATTTTTWGATEPEVTAERVPGVERLETMQEA